MHLLDMTNSQTFGDAKYCATLWQFCTKHRVKHTVKVYLHIGAWAVLGSEGTLNFPGPAWFSAATLKM